MPLLSPNEKSALELMLRNKLGSGAGTTALLKTLAYVNEMYVHPEPPEVNPESTPEEIVPEPAPEVVVTESSP